MDGDAPPSELQSSYFDFLSDDFLGNPSDPAYLDQATLAAICSLGGEGFAAASGLKRELDGDGSQGEGDSDEDNENDKTPAAKKARGEAARNKANREKARREKLNDKWVARWSPSEYSMRDSDSSWACSYPLRFNELSRLIEPGKEPKTDKNSILSDAVRYVQSLNCQNHQLKQLNKFLEVGPGSCISGRRRPCGCSNPMRMGDWERLSGGRLPNRMGLEQ